MGLLFSISEDLFLVNLGILSFCVRLTIYFNIIHNFCEKDLKSSDCIDIIKLRIMANYRCIHILAIKGS